MSGNLQFADYVDWIGSHASGTFGKDYYSKHVRRFDETTRLLETLSGSRAIEIGATDYIPLKLSELGFTEIWGSVFTDDPERKRHVRKIEALDLCCMVQTVSVNLEHDFFPVSDDYFDLIVFCEVLEHLDIDPMFTLAEFNRILRLGGKILLTTPNSASANNFWAILQGYRPHFYDLYEKSRSPYRHNFEHDVHSVYKFLESAGFFIETFYTKDVFYEENTEARRIIEEAGGNIHHRGDDIFCVATKTGPVKDRWPADLYA